MAELLSVAIGIRQLIGHSRQWGPSPSAAGMRRLPVSGPVPSLNGSFALNVSAEKCHIDL